jgi:hypothetical protein
MITEEIKITLETGGAVKNADKLKDKLKEVKGESEKSKEGMKNFASSVDGLTGGVIGKFGSMVSAVQKSTVAFRLMGSAIAATGIGLLVLVLASLIAAFRGSEEGQNKFAKIMSVIGVVTGNLVDLLASLGEKIIYVFSSPIKSIKEFANIFKTYVTDQIKGVIDGVGLMGTAFKKLFEGDFAGAADAAGQSVKKLLIDTNPLAQGIKAVTNATVEFGKETRKEMKLGAEVADQRAKAAKLDRALLVDRAKLESQISELKLNAREIDKFTASQRLSFLNKAQGLEDSLLKKEEESLSLKFKAQKLENTFSRTNIENADKEAQAEASLLNIKTRRTDQQKATLREVNRVSSEIRGEEKARNAESLAEEKIKQDALKKIQDEKNTALKKIQEESQKISDSAKEENLQKSRTDIENLKAKYDAEKQLLINSKISTAELDAQFARNKKAIEDKAQEEKLKKEDAEFLRLQELNLSKADFDTLQLIQKYEKEFALAEGNNALQVALKQKLEKDILEIDQKAIADELIRATAVKDAKIGLANNTLNLIAELAGRGSKIGKATAVAQATIAGYEGVQNAYTTAQKSPITTLLPAYPLIQAGLAGAFSAIQIKKILSTNAGGSTPPSSNTGGGGGQQAPSAPSFNLVQGTGANQIASSLGGQNQPVMAFVVSSAVTTAQALERNIISNSKF